LRLASLFDALQVQGTAEVPLAPPRTELRFKAAARVPAQTGISDLGVREGRLSGRSTNAAPAFRIAGVIASDPSEVVHAVQVRMRVSAGRSLVVVFSSDPKSFEAARDDLGPRGTSPLVAGEELRSYSLRIAQPIPAPMLAQVVVFPTDARDATFEIESIRIIFEREHLASIPSGVGWHGLSEIYREAISARAPERVSFELALPSRAWLDLALGTPQEAPITFRVSVRPAGEQAATVALERTLTTPQRWEPARVDLSPWAGEKVTLALELSSEAAGAIGFFGTPVVRSQVGAGQARTKVILIQADTLRRDHLDLYGYERETAPRLRRLAAEGAAFRDCVAQATWTKVSSPSILTSLYPSAHGVSEFSDRLPSSARTLAEVFRDAGYATLSLSSIFFTGGFSNLQQGFEELHEATSLPDPSPKNARELVDRLLPWLARHRDVPAFVFLHVFDPHDPYEPRPPHAHRFVDGSRAAEHRREMALVKEHIAHPLLRGFSIPTAEEIARAGLDPASYVAVDRAWYDASITGMDAEIGRLVEQLRTLGLERETVLAFTSDHGEEFLEHGRMFHGQSVYGELTGVPLVLWAPGRVRAGSVIEETVESIDIFPTLLELAGLPAPPGLHGRSLAALLHSKTWTPKPAIAEKAATYESMGAPPPQESEATAIVQEGWKLVHNTRLLLGQKEFELYAHATDPLDRTDVAAAHPDVVERLAQELASWRARMASERLAPDAEPAHELSAEELERLRSLGYVQ
jgi:arylsulfatase A-like enzyme